MCGKFKFHTAFFVIQSTKKQFHVKLISEQKNIRIGIALYGLIILKNLLGIQDLDITFKEDWLIYRKDRRNRMAQIIEGSLEKRPSHCPSCGAAWESTKDVYAHGTTPKKRVIQLTEINKSAYLSRTNHPSLQMPSLLSGVCQSSP